MLCWDCWCEEVSLGFVLRKMVSGSTSPAPWESNVMSLSMISYYLIFVVVLLKMATVIMGKRVTMQNKLMFELI